MPQRWAIWVAIEGDLRFLSHHDTMRAIERIATRADLPVRYSRGFNPRPAISLACPRPAGVATQDDLLVMSLEAPPEGIDGPDLLRRMNQHAPPAMRFLRAQVLHGKAGPRSLRADYELPLKDDRLGGVRGRLAALAEMDCWPVERRTPAKRRARSRACETREIDLKPLVAALELHGSMLRMSFVPGGNLWARPGEVLRLVGLDERADLAFTVRVRVDYLLEPGMAG